MTDMTLSIQQARERLNLAASAEEGTLTHYGRTGFDAGPGLLALRDAQVGTGHAVLLLVEEVSAVFQQLPDLSQAVRELTKAVTDGLTPLATITPALAGGQDTVAQVCTELSESASGLADLTTEAADISTSLTTVADAATRPPWWARLRDRFLRHHTDQLNEMFTAPPAAPEGDMATLVHRREGTVAP
jgi:hypothetical protein